MWEHTDSVMVSDIDGTITKYVRWVVVLVVG
jgi:phosphatidate phosphatase PAH1